jgi:RNA polymerase sigma factor (sigma-70 family)
VEHELVNEMPADRAAGQVRAGRRAPDPLRDPRPLIRRVYSYVAYRIGEGADAEDVTSDVFERALRYRNRYDPAKGTPTNWVLGIARRALAEHLGRPVPVPVSPDELEAEDTASPTEDTVVYRLTLDDALTQLSERDRELLSLRYGADLKARDIAAVLETETHAVEVALSRATARLRRLMGAG